jgi:hypothetical protein
VSAVGLSVTLQCTISRRECLIANHTYRTRKVAVGTVKKSMATITSLWFRRNVSQLCLRSPRGARPGTAEAPIRASYVLRRSLCLGFDQTRRGFSRTRHAVITCLQAFRRSGEPAPAPAPRAPRGGPAPPPSTPTPAGSPLEAAPRDLRPGFRGTRLAPGVANRLRLSGQRLHLQDGHLFDHTRARRSGAARGPTGRVAAV